MISVRAQQPGPQAPAMLGAAFAPAAGARADFVRLYQALGIALSLLLIFTAAYLVWPTDGALTSAIGMPAGQDFIAFYIAGRFAAAGQAAASYSLERMVAAYQALLDVRPMFTPWAYPPPVFLAVRPLGALGPTAAMAAFYAVLVAAAVAAGRIASGSWRLAPLALLAPQTITSLGFGQNGPISAAFFAVLFVAWTRAPVLAGAALGLLAYKPQLALVPALVALWFGAWRLLAAALATIALAVALSIAVDGTALWPAWLDAMASQTHYVLDGRLPARRMVTVFALAKALTGLPWLAALLHAPAAGFAIFAVIAAWQRSADPFLRSLTLACATLTVPPYAFDYDAAILIVPLALLVAGGAAAPCLTVRGRAWLLALCVLPVATFPIIMATGIHLMAPVLVGLLAAAARMQAPGLAAR